MTLPSNVDRYIASAPEPVRAALQQVRAAIRTAAPEAEESISYGMPFYSFRGVVGIEGRLGYFRFQGPSLRLYLRPKDLEPFERQIARYRATKSALHFPLDQPLPIALIRQLVREAVRRQGRGRSKSPSANLSSRHR